MTALISHTSFDSLDAHAMSVFWGLVLGFVEDPDDPNEPGHEECMIFSADAVNGCCSSRFRTPSRSRTACTWT